MASLEEIRNERLKKLARLREVGVDPYPSKIERTHNLTEVIEHFDQLEKADSEVIVAGRVVALRGQGGILFCVLDDGTAKLQALIKKDDLGDKVFDLFTETVDLGDFISVTGGVLVTKRGEKSVAAKSWGMLTKSLRPLPGQYYGFSDEEERLRRRYLDIVTNNEVRELVEKRSKFWQAIREFLSTRGFLEVETPILENTTGGAEARPFVTHHNALDLDVYLRISPELWLKRLLVAGLPKVFEIGRIFRNEGMSAEHLQDYTQMEFYWAYADYRDGMELVKELYRYVAEKTLGTTKFTVRGHEVDFSKNWEIYDYAKTIKSVTGANIVDDDLKTLEKKLQELDIDYQGEALNRNRSVDLLWKHCRKQITGPGFLINVPVFMEPLAKRQSDKPDFVERFQVILAGSEVGKGFSELNDPLDQAGRFAEQAKLREAGDEEAQMNDQDFVEALEYGMPPACGFGVSERLFSFLMDKPIRECQIFPLMKPRE